MLFSSVKLKLSSAMWQGKKTPPGSQKRCDPLVRSGFLTHRCLLDTWLTMAYVTRALNATSPRGGDRRVRPGKSPPDLPLQKTHVS
jgi:hypothetical protein